MANVDEKNVYAVVELPVTDLNKKKSIDLVPSKWIKEDSDGFSCRYPPPNEYTKLEKYASEFRDAKKNWAAYPMKILSYAGKNLFSFINHKLLFNTNYYIYNLYYII